MGMPPVISFGRGAIFLTCALKGYPEMKIKITRKRSSNLDKADT